MKTVEYALSVDTDRPSSKARTAAALRKAFRELKESLYTRRGDDQFRPESWSLGRIDPGWVYAMQLRVENGRWVVAELRVFPESDLLNRERMKRFVAESLDFSSIPLGGLTARQLRRIPFRQPAESVHSLMKEALAIVTQSARKNKALNLVRTAAVYVHLLRQHSRRPTADCARRLGLPVSRVRDAIHQARARKLLTGSDGQGSPGGELTAEALALLEPEERALLEKDESGLLDGALGRDETPLPARSDGRKTERTARSGRTGSGRG